MNSTVPILQPCTFDVVRYVCEGNLDMRVTCKHVALVAALDADKNILFKTQALVVFHYAGDGVIIYELWDIEPGTPEQMEKVAWVDILEIYPPGWQA